MKELTDIKKATLKSVTKIKSGLRAKINIDGKLQTFSIGDTINGFKIARIQFGVRGGESKIGMLHPSLEPHSENEVPVTEGNRIYIG